MYQNPHLPSLGSGSYGSAPSSLGQIFGRINPQMIRQMSMNMLQRSRPQAISGQGQGFSMPFNPMMPPSLNPFMFGYGGGNGSR